MLDDKKRAGIALLVGNIISAIVLFGIANWNGEQVAILNSIVNSALIVFGYFFKSGQEPGPTV